MYGKFGLLKQSDKLPNDRFYVTDFALLTGAYVNFNSISFPYDRQGSFVLGEDIENGQMKYKFNTSFHPNSLTLTSRINGSTRFTSIRPCIRGSKEELKPLFSLIDDYENQEFEFGSYPTYAASAELQKELTDYYYKNALHLTGKKYTIDSTLNSIKGNFSKKYLPEYEYNGKRYVLVSANFNSDKFYKLTNLQKYTNFDRVWVEVCPERWNMTYNDETKEYVAVCQDLILAGIPVLDSNISIDCSFNATLMNKFIQEELYRDLFVEKTIVEKYGSESKEKTSYNTVRPYNFNIEKVNTDQMIKGAIESNVPVFIHGKSGDGKSARVKQYDPDPTIIYLRNATPDFLNGKSVYNAETGEMIDVMPSWLKKLYEKCEKEPDRLHILFFDELTNALPSIQGMVFNIVLDREVNGTWKLPDNVRIVAAGNDLDESLSANQMSEPLFNRFAHVYINTTVDDWLLWAETPRENIKKIENIEIDKKMTIHPAIYVYILYKSKVGIEVLRTKFDGIKPNADPRKWEMASNVLYATGQPRLLESIVGKNIADDFCNFVSQKVISLEDVINHNYDDNIFKSLLDTQYVILLELLRVDEDNVNVVRDFIKRMDDSMISLFDDLWCYDNDDRRNLISENNNVKSM